MLFCTTKVHVGFLIKPENLRTYCPVLDLVTDVTFFVALYNVQGELLQAVVSVAPATKPFAIFVFTMSDRTVSLK